MNYLKNYLEMKKMPNKNYENGVRFERKVVNKARDLGLIAFRSAGSHSPFDVVIIDKSNRIINLIQCKKAKSYDKSKYLEEVARYTVYLTIMEEAPDLRKKKKKNNKKD